MILQFDLDTTRVVVVYDESGNVLWEETPPNDGEKKEGDD